MNQTTQSRGEIKVRRVKLDRNGYGRDGRQWGKGAPLFEVDGYHDGQGFYVHMRAVDYQDARRSCGRMYPGAKVLP